MIGERERCYRKGWDVGTGRGRGAIGRVGMSGRGRGAIGRVGMIGERERERCYRKGWAMKGG